MLGNTALYLPLNKMFYIFSKGLTFLMFLLSVSFCAVYANAKVVDKTIAFPGAEGFGKYAQGGRGGEVYIVNTTSDYDPKTDKVIKGSLRDGIESRRGIGEQKNGQYQEYIPRTIVFNVSGTIALKSTLTIKEPLITIAGQTAPGDGITLRDYGLNIKADDVIIRYIRSRTGNVVRTEKNQADAISIKIGKNIIIDHCSASWSVDETLSSLVHSKDRNSETLDVDLITVQWTIISESLNNAGHEKGEHGYGSSIGGYRQSYHHNLFAHHKSRLPKITWRRHTHVDFRNNIIYNWGANSSYNGTSTHANWVNNYYKPGPATQKKVTSRIFQIHNDPKAKDLKNNGIKFYMEGNFMEGNHEVSTNNWLGVNFKRGAKGKASELTSRVFKPFNYPPISQYVSHIKGNNQLHDTNVVESRYLNLLKFVGASHARDTVDDRVVTDVLKGRASNIKQNESGEWEKGNGIINSPIEVGGWPVLSSQKAPIDSDNDGMPNSWEDANGLNKADASDRNKDLDNDGFTELEEYLNSLVPYEGITLSL